MKLLTIKINWVIEVDNPGEQILEMTLENSSYRQMAKVKKFSNQYIEAFKYIGYIWSSKMSAFLIDVSRINHILKIFKDKEIAKIIGTKKVQMFLRKEALKQL
jgi:hypothetical protein